MSAHVFTDDDPRHGTSAGAMAHSRAGTPRCAPCFEAKTRDDKRRRVYGSALVELPDHIWAVVRTTDLRLLSRTTGVSEGSLRNIRERGGQLRVYRSTLERLEGFDPITDLGVRRRAQALAVLGWTSRQIAKVAGIHNEYVRNAQNRDERCYMHQATRDGIVAAYDALHMTPAPQDKWTKGVRRRALAKGWAPPLAWDNIDDPNARPQGVATGRRVA